MQLKQAFGGLLFSLLTVLGCERSLTFPSWNVDAVVPVLSTELSLLDRVKDSLVIPNEENILTITYERKLTDLALDTVFELPDTAISSGFELNFGNVTVVPGQFLVNDSSETTFSLKDLKLTEVFFQSGKLAVEIENTIDGAAIMNYRLPYATRDGNVFSFQKNIPSANGGSSFIRDTFDLAGFRFQLRGINQNLTNTVATALAIQMDPNGMSTLVNAGDFITATTRFLNAEPYFIRGVFEPQTIVAEDTEPTDIFANISGGDFDLQEAEVSIQLTNYLGADLEVGIEALRSLNAETSTTQALESDIIGKRLLVARASRSTNALESVRPVTESFSINTENANLDELLEIKPTALAYNIALDINPLGNIAGANDFLFTEKSVEVFLRAEVPLHLSSNGLTITDTSEYDFGPKENNEDWVPNIIGGQLLAQVTNYYPFDADLFLTVLDEQNNTIRTLTAQNNRIAAAEIDGNAVVTAPTKSTVAIPLNQTIIDDLYAGKKMEIRFSLFTNDRAVKLFDGQRLQLNLVGDLEYDLE